MNYSRLPAFVGLPLLAPLSAMTPLLAPAPVLAEIEEIMVTAQRREESSQDVPISITALGSDDIRSIRIERTVDLGDQVPNVLVEEQFGLTGPRVTMRGIVNADFNAVSNTPVTVYSDGVVLNSIQDHGFAMFDTERVELLRGPQGTFFGRNSTTGAIQFVSAQPTMDLQGYARATVARFGQRRFEGAVSGPIAEDRLSGRLAVLSNSADGYVKNLFDGNDTPDADDLAVRGQLHWNADGADATLKVQYAEGDGQAILFHNALPTNTITGEPGGVQSDYEEIILNRRDRTESIDSTFVSLNINIDVGDFVLTSITGYSEHEFYNFNDDDASSITILDEYFANDQDQFSQEFNLTSPADGDFEWIAGAYFLTESVESQTAFDFTDLVGIPGVGFAADNKVQQELDSYALFVDAKTRFGSGWTLIGGIRWSQDEKDYEQTVVPCFAFDPSAASFVETGAGEVFVDPAGGCPANGTVVLKESWNDLSGRIALQYEVSENAQWYGTYAVGFKGGGFNGGAGNLDEIGVVEPEQVKSFEVGLKTSFAGGRAQFNASAFFYDYENLQQFALGGSDADTNILARRLINVPESEVLGVEAELYWHPLSGLEINLGVGLVETEFTDFIDAGGNNYEGNDFPSAPGVNFNGLVRYEFRIGPSGFLALQTDFSYIDEYFVDIDNTPSPFMAGDFWDVNLRMSWIHADQQLTATAFWENVTDEVQLTNHFDVSAAFGSTISTVRRPSTVGLTIGYEF